MKSAILTCNTDNVLNRPSFMMQGGTWSKYIDLVCNENLVIFAPLVKKVGQYNLLANHKIR